MGLTSESTGRGAVDHGLVIEKQHPQDRIIALAGNPNVGKSTVFNELTGLHQHTGNWPGKTVTNAQGYCEAHGKGYVLVDLPGCYSLMAHSAEEEVARDFICFGKSDAVIVVCDATCLERNLNLVLQTLEITRNVVVCVNLLDEAKKKKIHVDLRKLSQDLGVPVVGTAARSGKGLDELMQSVEQVIQRDKQDNEPVTRYDAPIEQAIANLIPEVEALFPGQIDVRFLSLKLLDIDDSMRQPLIEYLGFDPFENERLAGAVAREKRQLAAEGVSELELKDRVVSAIVKRAEDACKRAVSFANLKYMESDRKLDRLFTSKKTGFPIMFLLLALIFWITIVGANVPSQMLSDGLFYIEDQLYCLLDWMHFPVWLNEMLTFGVYRVLAWVVSVMLPPMAIFFPLFTLLEDSGYLPRVAFNLDKGFQKCHACGKQALTMWMGKNRMPMTKMGHPYHHSPAFPMLLWI